MGIDELLAQIEDWDPEQLIAYLEQHGDIAPEYDLEAGGIEMLRRDCIEKALQHAAAAAA